MFTSGKKCSVQEESFGLATLAGGGWEVVIKGVRTHTTTTSQKKPRIAMMTFSRYRDFPKTFFTVNTPQTLSIRCSSNNTCAGNPDDIHPAATYTDNKIKRGLSGHCSPTNSWATLWTCTHTHTHTELEFQIGNFGTKTCKSSERLFRFNWPAGLRARAMYHEGSTSGASSGRATEEGQTFVGTNSTPLELIIPAASAWTTIKIKQNRKRDKLTTVNQEPRGSMTSKRNTEK